MDEDDDGVISSDALLEVVQSMWAGMDDGLVLPSEPELLAQVCK